GPYGNLATVTAKAKGGSVTASDPNYHIGTDAIVSIRKSINAADPLHPTAAEDANDPNNPRLLATGTAATWTYLVTNPRLPPLTVNHITDAVGTPGVPGDDFHPAYVSGDANNNHLLDVGETWLYTSQGVVNYSVQPGQYGNLATVAASGPSGQTVTANDPSYH